MSQESEPPARMSAEELFRIHGAFVARFLVQLGVPRDELDDVVQEVFLVVHARGGYVAGPAKPTSYLGSIAVRAAHSARRRVHAQRHRAGQTDADSLPSSQHDPSAGIDAREDAARVRRALASLPEDLRAVLLLVELEGEGCASVAASMGCAVGTIYWRLHTAKKRFRRALEDDAAGRATLPAHVRDGWES
jgi:RNA polymerase sigma-70 factor (ECF subfamily)